MTGRGTESITTNREAFLDATGTPDQPFAQTGEPDPLALTIGIRTPATVQLTVTYRAA